MNGIDLIQLAREIQIAKGYTPEHDREHENGELLRAAQCYLEHGRLAGQFPGEGWISEEAIWRYSDSGSPFRVWPWEDSAWQPDADDPIKDLAKAGALIAAEIDRLLNVQRSASIVL